jgi:hypothetical protein
MSNAQFVSAMAVASALNTLAVIVGILINDIKLRGLRASADALFDHVDRRFDEMGDVGRDGRTRAPGADGGVRPA